MKPLAIDLFCGLGGWAEGFLAEGYDVIGFDIERHRYPRSSMQSDGRKVAQEAVDFNNKGPSAGRSFNYANQVAYRNSIIPGEWDEYPGQLVLQDVLTLHGSQFKDAAVIVASPPCQAYSYRAMPWKRAKALPPPSNELFDACFRIQREASEAAGRYIPLVVENVRGAERWVGGASWHFGSFYLWGDIPALMPNTFKHMKNETGGTWFGINGSGKPATRNCARDRLVQGIKDRDTDGYERTHPTPFGWNAPRTSSRSSARKAASAQIAKIPFPLANHIARVYKPSRADARDQFTDLRTTEMLNNRS